MQIGERVFFEQDQPDPAKENRVQKKKIWEDVAADLRTDGSCTATYKDLPMMTSAGPVLTATLKDARVS